MSERSHEELSALMDGEASDLELRRTLKSLDSDSELLQKWRRYHLSRSVVQGDMKEAGSAGFAKLDITQAVSAAIEKEAAHDISLDEKPSWFAKVLQPLSSVAVAASVSAMVVFGWQTFQQQGGSIAQTDNIVAQQSTQVAPTLVASTNQQRLAPTTRNQVNSGFVTVSESRSGIQNQPALQHEIVRMTVNKNQRLNHYLVSHSGNAALNTASGSMSYTRVVHIEP